MTGNKGWVEISKALDNTARKFTPEELQAIRLASNIMDVLFDWSQDGGSAGPFIAMKTGDFVPFAIDMQRAVCKALNLPYKEVTGEDEDDDGDGLPDTD